MPRILVAVTPAGGSVDVVNVGRPGVLVAFGDKFGRSSPNGYGDLAWLAHRAIVGKDGPELDEWLEGLDELTADPGEIARGRRAIADELNPAERLEYMTATELVALAGETVDVDGVGQSALEHLVGEAAAQLEADRVERERLEAGVLASQRLAGMSDRELEAMPTDELRALRELAEHAAGVEAGAAEAVPTIPTPAITGGAG